MLSHVEDEDETAVRLSPEGDDWAMAIHQLCLWYSGFFWCHQLEAMDQNESSVIFRAAATSIQDFPAMFHY